MTSFLSDYLMEFASPREIKKEKTLLEQTQKLDDGEDILSAIDQIIEETNNGKNQTKEILLYFTKLNNSLKVKQKNNLREELKNF
jgi:CHASE3 domain sensor protein